MKVSQLRQIIREEIRGAMNKLPTEKEVARKLLTNLQEKFKEGAEIELTPTEDPEGVKYKVAKWNWIDAITLEGEPGVFKIPFKEAAINALNITVDGEPIKFGEYDNTGISPPLTHGGFIGPDNIGPMIYNPEKRRYV